VPREDAVFNVQRVALLLASLQTARPAALSVALEDRLHQPYRLKLFPWMPDVATAARTAGALGCVLSGAGPSLLAVVDGNGAAVGRAMEEAANRAGVRGQARTLDVDDAGATSRVS
jgi:homoserine kinase